MYQAVIGFDRAHLHGSLFRSTVSAPHHRRSQPYGTGVSNNPHGISFVADIASPEILGHEFGVDSLLGSPLHSLRCQ